MRSAEEWARDIGFPDDDWGMVVATPEELVRVIERIQEDAIKAAILTMKEEFQRLILLAFQERGAKKSD